MELMNKKIKGLDFSNTIKVWQLHSQNVIFALSFRVFVTAEHSNHRSLQAQGAKHNGYNSYTDMSMKGQVGEKSTPTNRTKEKILCHEILSLFNTFIETPKRIFDNNTYWSVLESTPTSFALDNESEIDTLQQLTLFLFDTNTNVAEEYAVGYVLLDNTVVGALTSEARELIDDDTNLDDGVDVTQDESQVEVEIAIGISKTTKIKKVLVNESTHCKIIQKCMDRMKAMNLPAVRYRRNK